MNIRQAKELAVWVNTHDDGTAGERAMLVCENHGWVWVGQEEPSYSVAIRSTEFRANGEFHEVVEYARSVTEARRILNY